MSDANQVIEDIAAALGCDPDNEAILAKIDQLQSALQPFAALKPDDGNESWMADHCLFGLRITLPDNFYSSTITLANIKAARAACGDEQDKKR